MSTPHKNAEVIKAWAEGKAVQYRYLDVRANGWFDYKDGNVWGPWDGEWRGEWRVKPDTVKLRYRVGLFNHFSGPYASPVDTDSEAEEAEKYSSFIR